MYISWLTGNFYYLYNIIFKFYELCLHIYLYFGVPLFVKNFMVKFLNSIADLNLRKITHIQTFCCQKKSHAPCFKLWLLFDCICIYLYIGCDFKLFLFKEMILYSLSCVKLFQNFDMKSLTCNNLLSSI